MSENLVGECENFEEFEEAIKKFYINRKVKSKGKELESEADRIPCDIIIAIKDRMLVVWPSVSSGRLRPIRFLVKKEDWREVLKSLTKLLQENKMRKPIRFASVQRENYLIGFCNNYEDLEDIIKRLYLERLGKKGDIRCDIHISRNEMMIYAAPNKETPNLIELRLDVQDPDKWVDISDKVKRFCKKEGILFQEYARVAKW